MAPPKGTRPPSYRHGHGRNSAGKSSSEYAAWACMKARCSNSNHKDYPLYGGAGIKVCDRWGLFDNFLADVGLKPSAIHQIDRVNNAGNYEPDNCRWATPQEQANNRRSNRLITYGGKTQTLAQWAREIGVQQATLHARMRYGWTFERIVTTPLRGFLKNDPVTRGIVTFRRELL